MSNALPWLLEPIQQELSDPTVTEIVCQKPGEIGVERGDGWTWRPVPEFTFKRLDAIGILSAGRLSKRFDRANPICVTTLPGGQRCTLAGPPFTAPATLSMTIRIPSTRKHTVHDPSYARMMQSADHRKVKPRNAVDDLLLELYYAKNWPAFFSAAVKGQKNIGATGDTGSGKTYQITTFMQEIPLVERVITIEKTREFGEMPHRNRVELLFGSSSVGAIAAVECTKSMRPDRILMQELTGEEAFPYLQIIGGGHRGGLTTWHSDENDPWTPLELMVKTSKAGQTIPHEVLRPMLKQFIDIVLYCRRDEVDGQSVYSVPSVWFRAAEEAEQQRIAA